MVVRCVDMAYLVVAKCVEGYTMVPRCADRALGVVKRCTKGVKRDIEYLLGFGGGPWSG